MRNAFDKIQAYHCSNLSNSSGDRRSAFKLAFHNLLRSSSKQKAIVILALTTPLDTGLQLPPYASAARHGALGLLRSFTVTGNILIKVVAPTIPGRSISYDYKSVTLNY